MVRFFENRGEMDAQELLRALKGNDREVVAKLEALRLELGLQKLYLIYLDGAEVAWGARYPEDFDEAELFKKLREFLVAYLEMDYASGDKKFLVFNSDIDEVQYVAHRALASLEYRGFLEVLAADEAKGEALLTVGPSFQKGVKNALAHLLPWIKESEVKFSNPTRRI